MSGTPHVFSGTAVINYQGRTLNRVCLLCGLRGSVVPDAHALAAEGHPDKVAKCHGAVLPRPDRVTLMEDRPYMGGVLKAGQAYVTASGGSPAPVFAGLTIFTKPGATSGETIYLTPDEFIDPNDFTDAAPLQTETNPETRAAYAAHAALAVPSLNA